MTKTPSHPSIDLLVQIFDRFGGRPATHHDGCYRWPLAKCSGSASRVEEAPERLTRFPIQVLDLAVKGVGFSAEEPLEPGTRLVVEVYLTGFPAQSWPCRVVNVVPNEVGGFRVGAAFETWVNPRASIPGY